MQSALRPAQATDMSQDRRCTTSPRWLPDTTLNDPRCFCKLLQHRGLVRKEEWEEEAMSSDTGEVILLLLEGRDVKGRGDGRES